MGYVALMNYVKLYFTYIILLVLLGRNRYLFLLHSDLYHIVVASYQHHGFCNSYWHLGQLSLSAVIQLWSMLTIIRHSVLKIIPVGSDFVKFSISELITIFIVPNSCPFVLDNQKLMQYQSLSPERVKC